MIKEFSTISELQAFRKNCPICLGTLYPRGYNTFDNKIQYKVSFKAETYLFDISANSSRISFKTVDILGSDIKVNSINPIILSRACNKITENIRTNEYCLNFSIIYNKEKIEKIFIGLETYIFYFNDMIYTVKINHILNKLTIDEGKKFHKTKNTYNLNYNTVNQDKIYNKNYILNKIQTILLLK